MSEKKDSSTLTRFLMTSACFVVVIWGLHASQEIFVPFLLSVFVAVLAAPPLFWLKSKGLPSWGALVVVLLAVVIGVGAIGSLIGSSANGFGERSEVYGAEIQEKLDMLYAGLESVGWEAPEKVIGDLLDPSALMGFFAGSIKALTGVLANAFLIFITVLFILLEAATFSGKLQAAFGQGQGTLGPFEEFLKSVNRYLAIKTGMSALTGVLAGIFLAIMGVPFAALWGLVAFLLNYIPTIGSIIAALPAVLLALVAPEGGVGLAIGVAAGYAVLNVGIGNVLEPRLMGRGLGLSALVIFLSLAFWGSVLGLGGALLSVPLTVAVKIALNVREDTRWLAILMGSSSGAVAAVTVKKSSEARPS